MRSLVVGDWIVSRCDDGSLEVEYALFDASDVLLSAAARGFGTREQGYLTTAGIALERLRDAGVTAEIARDAFEALGSLEVLARSPSVARVASQLEPCEAFQGASYRVASRSYEGAWLDLDAVARATDLDEAALAMQLVHLVLVMEELPKNAPVRLLDDGGAAKPGERTWRRVSTRAVPELPRALREAARPIVATAAADEAELRDARVRELRARADLAGVYRPRLHALASALAREAPPAADVTVIEEDAFEPTPLVDELRTHADMLTGELHVREVAQFLTAMTTAGVSTNDLAILASRAWLASGEIAYARYFARRVVEDAGAPRATRLAANEILDSTGPTNESMRAPVVRTIEPTAIIIGQPHEHAPPGASLPPARRASTLPVPPAVPAPRVEIVETMVAPPADTARIRMTELARELARDYRLAYGVTLKTDVESIEVMQRHLQRRFGEGEPANKLEHELTRHGALLSEILARTLGAYWLDTASPELGRWAMIVPPRTRVWPIGRVYRYFQQGRREGDLVSFYLELAGSQ